MAGARLRGAIAIGAAALAVAAAGPPAALAAGGSCKRPHANGLKRLRLETLCYINRVRASHGVRRVHVNARLRRAARRHARAMVRHRQFAHYTSFDGSPASRVAHTGYLAGARRWLVGENMAWTREGPRIAPATMVRLWLASPPHRHVMLMPRLHDIGVSVAFGTPAGRRGFTFVTDYGAR